MIPVAPMLFVMPLKIGHDQWMLAVTAPEIVPLLASGISAIVGAFVGYQGYRGHRRNENRTLLYLTVGIFFLTTGSFLLRAWIELVGNHNPTVGSLAFQLVNIVGLLTILYSFTRT